MRHFVYVWGLQCSVFLCDDGQARVSLLVCLRCAVLSFFLCEDVQAHCHVLCVWNVSVDYWCAFLPTYPQGIVPIHDLPWRCSSPLKTIFSRIVSDLVFDLMKTGIWALLSVHALFVLQIQSSFDFNIFLSLA